MDPKDRMLQLNQHLNEEAIDKVMPSNKVWTMEIPAGDIKKIKEIIKAAELLELDTAIRGLGFWSAGGDAIFGTPMFTLKGRTLYHKSDDPSDRGKLFKAEPENSRAKIELEFYRKK